MFGQIDTYSPTPKSGVPEWAAGTAAIIEAAAQPAVDAYAINQRAEVNAERIKAGLPPLSPIQRRVVAGPPIPKKQEGFGIGPIILAVIIVVLLFR